MNQLDFAAEALTAKDGGSAVMEVEVDPAAVQAASLEDQKPSVDGSGNRDSNSSEDGDSAAAPTLPPSTGDIDIPESSISYLFSVYNFLRSFSRQLFLSPFGLEDFVAALNCATQNSLFDAIHVSLLRGLRRHLEAIHSEGSETAAKCLRYQDWSLIDNLTWPVFLVEYLHVMGHLKELESLGLGIGGLISIEYHRLPVSAKLQILHVLCDYVLDSTDIVAELETRENMDEEKECIVDADIALESRPRRVHPRYSKTSACKDAEALASSVETLKVETRSQAMQVAVDEDNVSPDENSDECSLCGMDGTLICCDGCPSAYHARCIGVSKAFLPDKWFCPECAINMLGLGSSRIGRGLRGAEVFGTDPYGRVFFGTCHYLLVLGLPTSTKPCSRYYNRDDITKLRSFFPSERENVFDYTGIFHGILEYFELSQSTLAHWTEAASTPGVCDNGNYACLVKKNSLENIQGTAISLKLTHGVSLKNELCAYVNGRDKRPSRTAYYSKPHAYVNQYMYGDVAASAAANMANIDPQESTLSEDVSISNSKKIVSAQITAQMKAFSAASAYFMWPSFEKKVMEVPRERCGWCIACKGEISNKKGCFFNLAASGAFKVSARYISSISSVKNEDNYHSVVAAHVSHMERSLHCLLDGPLSDPEFNKQWHRQLRETSGCRILKDLKFLLLELEKSIRGIVLLGSWNKYLDDGLVELHAIPLTTCISGLNQKRGIHGRRGKRQNLAPESSPKEDDWMWWQGGKTLNIVFQKWMLPELLVRKAARQGGCRSISGICYPENFELPRRSRQFAWRSSVDNSRNMSQLALQVRYLDAFVRWRDLVRPEQAPLDGKGSESDYSVFRNAVICDKRTTEGKILYGLSFSNQKHLPLRVTKTVVETEDTQDGSKKLWFSEAHIPLYLIKEYEEKCERAPPVKANSPLFNFRRIPLKACRWKNPFSYLWNKEEMSKIVSCASCRQDVVMRDTVKCNKCQGSCHKGCVKSSTVKLQDDLGFLYTCNACVLSQSSAEKKPIKTVIFKLSSQKQGSLAVNATPNLQSQLSADTIPKPRIVFHHGSLGAAKLEFPLEEGSNASALSSGRKRKPPGEVVTFGLVWKKKKEDQSGQDFRVNNIILKCKDGLIPSRKPICALCGNIYRSDLMYICCEKCLKWFHADALHLEEAQILDLAGFKCNKCRRRGIPKCPYSYPTYRKQDNESSKKLKIEKNGVASCIPNISVAWTPAFLSHSKDDDSSTSDHNGSPVESPEFSEPASIQELESDGQFCGSGLVDGGQCQPGFSIVGCQEEYLQTLQKLPVRKNNIQYDVSMDELYSNSDNVPDSEVVWDVLNLTENVHTEEMEYEPQTYFSFTELLASEDGEFDDLCGKPVTELDDLCDKPVMDENWCSSADCGDFEAMHQDATLHDPNEMSGNYISNEPAHLRVPCKICNVDDPSADFTCVACGLSIHSYCSPWVDSEEPGDSGQWKCGRCREWC